MCVRSLAVPLYRLRYQCLLIPAAERNERLVVYACGSYVLSFTNNAGRSQRNRADDPLSINTNRSQDGEELRSAVGTAETNSTFSTPPGCRPGLTASSEWIAVLTEGLFMVIVGDISFRPPCFVGEWCAKKKKEEADDITDFAAFSANDVLFCLLWRFLDFYMRRTT